MIINQVKAVHFKSYDDLSVHLSSDCNVIYGLNGSGKTNFLDLLHFICFGKSYFSITDKQAIKDENDFFRIEANLSTAEGEEVRIAVSVPMNGRKKIWYNGAVLKKNTNILGLVPLVCIVPDDIDLIRGSSIVRRKFMDRILCQINPRYTECLINYERALKQKLAILKNTSSLSELNLALLDSYDQALSQNGKEVYLMRVEFCKDFNPLFQSIYTDIASKKEISEINFQSNFDIDSFVEDSLQNRDIDFYTKRVRKGIHRDDLQFIIDGQNVRKFGSQGQIKTFIYALKLSEYLFLSDKSKRRPILLLDDIFEKLDRERLNQLFKVMTSAKFGQIFITDTEKNRSIEILENFGVKYSTFAVEKNKISNSDG